MLEPKAPCLHCEKRYLGCQGKCDDYKSYKKAHDEWASIVRKERNKDYEMADIERQRFKKYNESSRKPYIQK